ncbi:MAG: hypothetical protein D4R97_04500 [Bacteroidetes bacterium]|nr:MAG: hypothetical protein D4R97_04500 [Bacteroidota bacterium]
MTGGIIKICPSPVVFKNNHFFFVRAKIFFDSVVDFKLVLDCTVGLKIVELGYHRSIGFLLYILISGSGFFWVEGN